MRTPLVLGLTMRRGCRLLLCAGLIWLTGQGTASAQALADPVEKLREVLNAKMPGGVTPESIKARLSEVRAATNALVTIPEMLQGLLVQQGIIALDSDSNLLLQKGYLDIQVALRNRLKKQIDSTLKGNDAPRQVALLTMIRSVAEEWRSLQTRDSDLGERFRNALAEMTPSIIPLVRSPSEEVQIAAILALSQMDTSTKEIAAEYTAILRSGNQRLRRAVAEAIGTVARLIAWIKNNESYFLKHKVEVLLVELPVLQLAMRDADFLVRRRGTNAALQTIRFMKEVVVESKVKGIDDERDSDATPSLAARRKLAAKLTEELIRLGETLRQAGQDSDIIVRALAFETVEQLGLLRNALPPPPPPPMKEREVRLGAPLALPATPAPMYQMQPVAYLARPRADEEAPAPKKNQALQPAIEATLPALQRALTDPNIRVRLSALEALGALGDDASTLIPDLVRTLTDRDRFVRWSAARVLGGLAKFDQHAASVVAGLDRMLCDPDTSVRIAAVRALAEYKTASIAALPGLVDQLVKADFEVRVEVINTLLAIGIESAPAIPALTENLGSSDPRVRRAAAEALGRFGPTAASAVARLERTNFDEDVNVRRAAAAALLRISRP